MNYPLVIVDWEDHTGDAGWHTDESIKDLNHVNVRTVGYLVDDNDKSYKVADSIIKEGGFGGVSVILKADVIQIWDVYF